MTPRASVLHTVGSPTVSLSEISALIANGVGPLAGDIDRALVLVPDDTRKLPVSQMFAAVWDALSSHGVRVDAMIAQGTHTAMPVAAKRHWVYGTREYPRSTIHDHAWADEQSLIEVGIVPLSDQKMLFGAYGDVSARLGFDHDIPVRINRRLLEYDRILLVTRVQPHEGAGFAGGAKQLFPGASGPEMINLLHTIGSLRGASSIQGVLNNPVRELIDDMADLVPVPITTLAVVIDDASSSVRGVFVQPDGWREVTHEAAALSAEVNVRYVPHRVRRVVAATPQLPDGSWLYPELWTGAKGVFRGDDAVGDGGELVLYAPGVREISATHGDAISRVGLHGWPYLLAHLDKWQPLGISPLALTLGVLIKGDAPILDGRESPRIDVRLATALDPAQCRALGVGYECPDTVACEIRDAPADTIENDRLVMHNAGSILWRHRPPTSHPTANTLAPA